MPAIPVSDAAGAMKPLAGDYAFILFAAGLFNASLFAASILPLSTAYTVCEGLGLESGLDKTFREAKFFYWFYTLLLAAGAAVVLIPNFPLVKFSILSQVLNGVLLPIVLCAACKIESFKAGPGSSGGPCPAGPFHGGDAVVERRRKRMLRRERILHAQAAQAGAFRNLAREAVIGVETAHDPAAPV